MFTKNTPGTRAGPGDHDRTLAVKSRKDTRKSDSMKNKIFFYLGQNMGSIKISFLGIPKQERYNKKKSQSTDDKINSWTIFCQNWPRRLACTTRGGRRKLSWSSFFLLLRSLLFTHSSWIPRKLIFMGHHIIEAICRNGQRKYKYSRDCGWPRRP